MNISIGWIRSSPVLRRLALPREPQVEAVQAVFGVLILHAADVARLLVTVGAGLAAQGPRRSQPKLLELMGKLEWDTTFDYKRERSRDFPSAE